MNALITKPIAEILQRFEIEHAEFSLPPKPEMGDVAFPVFVLAKKQGKNPAELASELAQKLQAVSHPLITRVQAFGPYVNFFLSAAEVTQITLSEIKSKHEQYGSHAFGAGKKYLIEFACPNPLKAFHLGHLKNLITGESVVRVFENAGYEVVRVNYQGDVGMHVAKAMWGIVNRKKEFEAVRERSLKERVEFLGQCYAYGATHYEQSDAGKAEVVAYNDIIYDRSDASVIALYEEARSWSLEYFDAIYKRLGTHFDQLYFESQMFERGVELVENGLKQGIFQKSDGAIIFEGSTYGLHDRVFINSKGFPTYEAKDLALAEAHFQEHHPDMVIHVVGKEQKQYFEVLFQALEFVLPETKGKEFHLIGGFLQLKGDQKMSSRKGNIITGDALLQTVEEKISDIMKESLRAEKTLEDDVCEKVSVAALKYGMLKSDVSADVAFDLDESVSVSGDSGPYLLYMVARIKSILKKAKREDTYEIPKEVTDAEKQLCLKLAGFPDVTREAVESYDPSKIAKYLFDLAQQCNSFYHACPVLQEDRVVENFRLHLINSVLLVMERGLQLLGIETVEEM